jgi:hypothetical protein
MSSRWSRCLGGLGGSGALALAAACTVDGGDGFPGVSGGSAATLSTTVASTDGGASGSDDTAGGSGGSTDATSGGSSTGPVDSTGVADSGSGSGGVVDTGSTSGGGTPLDPMLDIPDDGAMCSYPGDLEECDGIAVCRFATVEYGLCESCDACGNLNAPCVEGTDCDILFECYAGRCTNFCTLGQSECGPVDACLDVGHPTRGVCDPFA